jgi:hypothetical protein
MTPDKNQNYFSHKELMNSSSSVQLGFHGQSFCLVQQPAYLAVRLFADKTQPTLFKLFQTGSLHQKNVLRPFYDRRKQIA